MVLARPQENRKSADVTQHGGVAAPTVTTRLKTHSQAKIDRLKFAVIVVNTFLFILGAITLGVSVFGLIRYKLLGYEETFSSVTIVTITPWIVTVSSTMSVTMVPLYGCYGAVAQKRNMLILFFLYILAMLLLEIGMVLWVIITSDEIQEEIADSLRSAIQEYHNIDKKRALDDLHKNFRCCGSDHGVVDFGSRGPPASCKHEYLMEPCNKKMSQLYDDYRFIGVGAFGALAVVLMLTIILVLSLMSALRRRTPPRPPDRRRPEVSVLDTHAHAQSSPPPGNIPAPPVPPKVVHSPALQRTRPPGLVRRGSNLPRSSSGIIQLNNNGGSNETSCV